MSQDNVPVLPPNDAKGNNNNSDTPKSDTNITNTKKFTLPQEIPKLPSLKESIQEFVITTNNALSSFEVKYHEIIQKPTTQAIHQLSDTTTTIREQVNQLYQQRHIYGPYTIVGTSLFAGGITTLRRGRISGIVSTIVVGGLSYGVIYGFDDETSPPAIDFSKMLPQSITDLWKSK